MQQDSRMSNMNLGMLWFGAAISLAEIMTGALLAPLGLAKGLAAILAGHVIGCAILYLTGLIGSKTGLPAIESTKISFGRYGAYLFSIINIIQLIGWTGVMIINGAKAFDAVTVSLFNISNEILWCILTALLIVVWILMGFKNLGKINILAVGSLLVFTLILGYIVFITGSSATVPATGGMSFGTAMELSIIMPLSWLPLISDYTRNARQAGAGPLFSAGGYFIGSVMMYAIGLGAALFAGTNDITAILLSVGLPAIALLMVLFSTVTTTFLDVYSAAVSFSALRRSNEKLVSILVCLLGLGLAVLVPVSRYESFLYLIGTAFAPLFAIMLTDYFLLKRRTPLKSPLNIRNAVLWVIGVVLYRLLMLVDTPLGSTLPTIIFVSIIVVATNRLFTKKENAHVR